MGFGLFAISFLIINFARIINIAFNTFILNFYRKNKISFIFSFVMWFSGFRGAMGIF